MGAPAPTAFEHEAVFYRDDTEFVELVGGFVRAGIESDEAVVVVEPRPRLEMLRASLFGGKPLLTPGRIIELSQASWTCDDTRARLDIDYESSIALPDGIRSTAEWYRSNRWL